MYEFSVFSFSLAINKKTFNFKLPVASLCIERIVYEKYASTWNFPSRYQCLRVILLSLFHICKPEAGSVYIVQPGAGNTGAAKESPPLGFY